MVNLGLPIGTSVASYVSPALDATNLQAWQAQVLIYGIIGNLARNRLQGLGRACRGAVSKPRGEDFQLFGAWIEKYDSHSYSLVDVNHLSFGCEAPLLM